MDAMGWTSPELVGIQVIATSAGRRRWSSSRTASGRAHDLHAQTAGARQVHDLVRGVVRPAGEDRLARGKIECAECHGEGRSGILDQGDVAGPRSHQAAEVVRHGGNRFRPCIVRLVAAEPLLEVEMVVDRLPDNLGHERRARIVQVHQAIASRRLRAPAREIRMYGGSAHPARLRSPVPRRVHASSSATARRHCCSNTVATASRSPLCSACRIRECGRVERVRRPASRM
jgi:hypothetical protein